MINKTPLDDWIEKKIGCSLCKENLLEYQFAGIRETVSLIKEKSPYYNRLLKDFNPGDLGAPEDLSVWPLTDRRELILHGPGMVCVPQEEINRVVSLSTSGTTGGNKRLWFTESDQMLTKDFFRVGMSTFTEKDSVVYIAMPGPRAGSIGPLLADALEGLGARGIVAGPISSVREAAEKIAGEDATHFVGLPKQAAALGAYLTSHGIRTCLKTFLLTADYVPETVKLRLYKTLGAVSYEHWGMTETGLGGGVSCGAMSGYHMREADLFVEVLDPVSSMPVSDGCAGEIVITTITRTGMPLFRYRTGDIGRWLTEECRCGSKLRLMDRIVGRLDDYLVFPDELILFRKDWEELLFSFENVVDYKIKKDPLSVEIIVLEKVEKGCIEALGRIFPGNITVSEVGDWSFSGPQKSFWSLIEE